MLHIITSDTVKAPSNLIYTILFLDLFRCSSQSPIFGSATAVKPLSIRPEASLLAPPFVPLNQHEISAVVANRGPNVIVEPSYETQDGLRTAFLQLDYDKLTSMLLESPYSQPGGRSIVSELTLLMKTHLVSNGADAKDIVPAIIAIAVCKRKSAIKN